MNLGVSRLQNMLAKAMGTWPVEPIFRLGLRKEWICNERPITICPIVTC